MHPEADAFLDAIFDTPDDDTPRLVYADWLAEHGQEHYAQFIRLQCAAARHPLWSDEANRLWEEIGRVWPRLDEEWWPATREAWLCKEWRSALLDAVHFRRGFPHNGFSVSDEQLSRFMGDEIWLPWLPPAHCSLVLTPVGRWDRLSSLPQLRRVVEVRLDYEEPWGPDELPDEIVRLLGSAQLCNLTKLDLSRLILTQRAIDKLLVAPNLASVQNLSVRFDYRHGPDPAATMNQLQARFKIVHEID